MVGRKSGSQTCVSPFFPPPKNQKQSWHQERRHTSRIVIRADALRCERIQYWRRRARRPAPFFTPGRTLSVEMSSPLTAEKSESHEPLHELRHHLKENHLSNLRSEAQSSQSRTQSKSGISADWSRAMVSFNKRLHWNGHFMQGLELQPTLEFTNMSRSMDGLRENDHNEQYFQAWMEAPPVIPWSTLACVTYGITNGSIFACGPCLSLSPPTIFG